MIVIRNIRVYTLERDSLSISWAVQNTTEDLASHTVSVWRSEAEVGPYTKASTEMNAEDIYTFTDNKVNIHSKHRKYHYRVRVTETGSGDTLDFGSTDYKEILKGANPGGVILEAFPDLEALEAIRRFDLTLKEYIGRRVLFLAHRSTGTRCSICWDKLKRRRTRSDCQDCYGTGVKGGYYRPQETYACKPPETDSVAPTPYMELEPNDVVMWFSSRPRISPRDLVIADDRRFRVINIRMSEKLWAVTRQTVQLRELSKDQIEYSIPITGWDINPFSASPRRQYIRATDINSYHDAVNGLDP